jgi:hypothetical protein
MSIRFMIIMVVAFLAFTVEARAFDDADQDGVEDGFDNCLLEANAGQEDADDDGYGNACDGDLNNNGAVDGADFLIFSQCMNKPGQGAGAGCFIADFNSDHRVNSLDYMIFEDMWGSAPGPSGLF